MAQLLTITTVTDYLRSLAEAKQAQCTRPEGRGSDGGDRPLKAKPQQDLLNTALIVPPAI